MLDTWLNSTHIGWFFLGAGLVLALLIISIERITYHERRAWMAARELDKDQERGEK